MPQTLVTTESFVGRLSSDTKDKPGETFKGYRGQLVESDHPAVKKWPGFFAVPETLAAPPKAVEAEPAARRR